MYPLLCLKDLCSGVPSPTKARRRRGSGLGAFSVSERLDRSSSGADTTPHSLVLAWLAGMCSTVYYWDVWYDGGAPILSKGLPRSKGAVYVTQITIYLFC